MRKRDAKGRFAKQHLTRRENADTIHDRLIEYQPDIREIIFSPLKQSKTVLLKVDDPKLKELKRVKEIILVFVPIKFPWILVSMPGYGSELIDISKKLKSISFMQLGLNSKLSRVLTAALNSIFRRI